MAAVINKVKELIKTTPGKIILGVIYAVMLLLVLMFYTGNGSFIYEAF